MNQLDLNFIEHAKEKYPVYFKDVAVLEIGAQDVNGNVRGPFENCTFTGVDWVEGKNVDIVCPAKDLDLPLESFNVLLSVNHLEHDPDWTESLKKTLSFLKPGGMLLLRWAGIGSAAHGPEFDPHGKLGYYPKSMAEVLEFLKAEGMAITEEYGDHNPYIGPMMNVIAQKL